MMKKIMMLGGLRYLIPVIRTAQRMGHYVITCDYLPDNIAHKYSDEYHNVSIIDKEAVLQLARELQIDGIMSFAVDPGVLTAAYVAEKMGLPSAGPYKSIEILQNKDKFRAFLAENGFNVPRSAGFFSLEETNDVLSNFTWPLIVKPTDSAGSKGVQRIDSLDELPAAFEHALKNSISSRVIIEEFIEKSGNSSDTDCFSVDGKLCFVSFSDQLFDINAANPYTPSAYSWPATMNSQHQDALHKELQRLLTLLKMGSSIYNIETRIGTNGKPYIMEVSPRGGGNRLSEVLKKATKIDLIEHAISAALGEELEQIKMPTYNKAWAEKILYAYKAGIFKSLKLGETAKKHLKEQDLWIEEGANVKPFTGANEAIGTLLFSFDSQEELERLYPIIEKEIELISE